MHNKQTYQLILFIVFFCSIAKGLSQDRLVLSGQELLIPQLNDPSFVGEEKRTQITAIGQLVDLDTKRSSTYINAEMPIYDNLSFGVDYFRNNFDFYHFSQAQLAIAYEISTGAYSHVKIAAGGGGETLKLDRFPTVLSNLNLLEHINKNIINFTYKGGLHFTNRYVTLGGYYTVLPAQEFALLQDNVALYNYELLKGFTGYLAYHLRLGQHVKLSPMLRYLSYTDDAILEGSLKLHYQNIFDLSVAYRNNYAINPAIKFQLFKSLAVSYSYEKFMGDLDFDDVHSFGLSYKFGKANNRDESEWEENAKSNIAKVDTIKKKKKEKKSKLDKKEEEAQAQEAVVATDTKEVTNDVLVAEKANAKPLVRKITNATSVYMAPRFYIVAKHFSTFESAYLYKEQLVKEQVSAIVGVQENDSNYYVFIDSDGNKSTAVKLLTTYKKQASLKDAYVLEVK